MREEVLFTLREVLHTGRADLRDETRIVDLVQDSIDLIELVAVLSNKYQIEVDPASLRSIRTVGDVVDYVARYQKTRVSSSSPLERF